MIGFVRKRIPASLTSAEKQIDLHEITIEADALLLNAVEIKAMRNII